MAKVVKLKKSDLVRLVEETLNILPNHGDLPKHLGEIEKILNEGKRTINRVYHLVLDLNLRDILAEIEKYGKLYQDIESTQKVYDQKFQKYDSILESYWDDYFGDNLDNESRETYNKFSKAVSELGNLESDMKTLLYIFEEIYDNARRKDILKDFTDTYPDQTINISTSLNKDNNEN
jgi:hypothetical protein